MQSEGSAFIFILVASNIITLLFVQSEQKKDTCLLLPVWKSEIPEERLKNSHKSLHVNCSLKTYSVFENNISFENQYHITKKLTQT